MTTTKTTAPKAEAPAPATPAKSAAPAAVPDAVNTPPAGGSYTFDPATGTHTLVTPSAVQE